MIRHRVFPILFEYLIPLTSAYEDSMRRDLLLQDTRLGALVDIPLNPINRNVGT